MLPTDSLWVTYHAALAPPAGAGGAHFREGRSLCTAQRSTTNAITVALRCTIFRPEQCQLTPCITALLTNRLSTITPHTKLLTYHELSTNDSSATAPLPFFSSTPLLTYLCSLPGGVPSVSSMLPNYAVTVGAYERARYAFDILRDEVTKPSEVGRWGERSALVGGHPTSSQPVPTRSNPPHPQPTLTLRAGPTSP